MSLFKDPKTMTEEERLREAEAKAQVLAWFSVFRHDPTEGVGSRETLRYTFQNLLVILLTSILYLTGIIGEGLYVAGIMTSFVFAIALSVSALYFARKDHIRANGS